MITRERTIIGSVSYRNRYWVYRIESYRLLLYQPILRASLQLQQLLTGRITQQTKGHSHPVTAEQGRAIWSSILERVGGGRRQTATWYQPPRITKRRRSILGLGHQRQMMPHPLHQQELITTVSTVNHT